MDERAVGYLKTLVYAAILGVPVAFAAVLFQTAIHDVTHVVWEDIPDALDWSEPAGWYVVLVPAIAGLLVAAACRLPGHGGHSPLQGLGMDEVHPIDLWSILLAGLASLALGLVLGPEAPLISLGLGLGVVAARLLRTGDTQARLIAFAGAFAAIAALFGNPLVAALLLFEVTAASGKIPSESLGRALLPGFVAAGTGGLVFTGVDDWPGLDQTTLSTPSLPEYDTVQLTDLAWCLLLAIVVAFLVVAIRHAAHAIAARGAARPTALLVVCGALVGAVAVAFRAATDEPVDLVLFSGQEALPAIAVLGTAWVIALLVLAKSVGYGLSLGAGFRGGPVFPAIAIGAAVGVLAADILPGLEVTPAFAAGIAAGTAAALRVPITAVVLVALLVGPSATDVAPIAVLAAAVGWLAATALPNPEDRAAEKEAAATEAEAVPS